MLGMYWSEEETPSALLIAWSTIASIRAAPRAWPACSRGRRPSPGLPRADEGGEVDGGATPLECREILIERAPVRAHAVLVDVLVLGDGLRVGRRDRFAFAGDLRRDALRDLGRRAAVDETLYSDCPSRSMNPGATTRPDASIVRVAGADARRPTAAIFPPRTPTSAANQGAPVPSTTRALVNTMS
jgi:hypothetical protein